MTIYSLVMRNLKLITTGFVISITMNILCILPYCRDYYERFKGKVIQTQYFNSNSPDNEVIEAVIEASITMKRSRFETKKPYMGLIPDIKHYIKHLFIEGGGRPNNYAEAYLYAGLSYYALKKMDYKVVDYLDIKAKKFSSGGILNYELTEVDQVPIGIMFLNLYKLSHDEEFFDVARNIFGFLKSKRIDNSNIIAYRETSPNEFSDGVGMIVPFLMEYFHVSQDSTALLMATENVNQFRKYGCDGTTGLPAHGYNKETHIKVGSANWGRGIGWYLLGCSYLSSNDTILNKSVDLLNYSQFPLSSNKFDSSTALMFEIFKKSRNPNERRKLDFIKPYITQDGLIMECSGDTYDLNNYSHFYGPAELTNGLFLILTYKE